MKIKSFVLLNLLFLTILFSACNDKPLQNEDLPGQWEAQDFKSDSLSNKSFNTYRLTFTADSLQILIVAPTENALAVMGMIKESSIGGIDMNDNTITLKSVCAWQLKDSLLITHLGKNETESKAIFKNGKLHLSPDPLLRADKVLWSEYKKQ